MAGDGFVRSSSVVAGSSSVAAGDVFTRSSAATGDVFARSSSVVAGDIFARSSCMTGDVSAGSSCTTGGIFSGPSFMMSDELAGSPRTEVGGIFAKLSCAAVGEAFVRFSCRASDGMSAGSCKSIRMLGAIHRPKRVRSPMNEINRVSNDEWRFGFMAFTFLYAFRQSSNPALSRAADGTCGGGRKHIIRWSLGIDGEPFEKLSPYNREMNLRKTHKLLQAYNQDPI